MKFTQTGGIQIVMNYDSQGKRLEVDVIDTGAGIKQDELDKLFIKFSMLSRTDEQNEQGVGLGLSICKQIVESSGGKIEAFSEGADRGSRFSFTMKMKPFDQALEQDDISQSMSLPNIMEESKLQSQNLSAGNSFEDDTPMDQSAKIASHARS